MLVAVAVLLGHGAARAHDLGAQAKLHAGQVTLEAYYDDDTAASEAKVRVTDRSGNAVQTGTTNDKGLWIFPAPPPGKYRVVVDAGGGHRASIELIIPEGTSTGAGEPATIPPAEPKQTISSGPPREQFTQFPWLRLLMGLSVVAGLAWLTRWWLQTRPTVADERPLA
jgi:hypothetical protein